MRTLLVLLALLGGIGGDDTLTRAILLLSGASSLEEMGEDEIERYHALHEHPLDLNSAGRSRLLASGILSSFQIEMLLKAREQSGSILSYTELSLVSGFTEEYVSALKPFTVLKAPLPPGQKERNTLGGSIMGRAAVRTDTDESGSQTATAFGLKAELTYGERAEFNWASRTTYSSPQVSLGTISAAYCSRRLPVNVFAGNFAARFGQGLTQWSGFSLESLNSVSAFIRKGGGIAATSSFSPDLVGLGADVSLGSFVVSAAVNFNQGPKPIANVSWMSQRLTAGVTANSERIGADVRLGLAGLALFSEVSLGWKGGTGAVAGLVWTPSYGNRLALQGRYFSPAFKKDYSLVAACFENSWITASAQAGWHFVNSVAQYKAYLKISPEFTAGELSLRPSIMLSSRYRPAESLPWRNEARAEISGSCGYWLLSARYNRVWCDGSSWLWYVEPGFKQEKAAAYLRFTLFKIDDWDNRIYVYERDAPQSFNVPAYYGRGWSGSLVGSIKFGKHSIYARVAAVRYFNSKPGRLEAKLQYSRKF